MKANFNKKLELHESEEDHDNPNHERTGDTFFDFIGKFCIAPKSSLFENDL